MVKRWGVLISGRGSNLSSLIDLRASSEDFDLRVVLSSSETAYGLLRARRAGVPTATTPFLKGTRKIDWPRLTEDLKSRGVTHIFLAGFMKILPEEFLNDWAGCIINLHPSLLPNYPGVRSIERAFEDGAPLGVTVHEVIKEVDAGQMICQRITLAALRDHGYSLAEFLVHIDEQRAVKEAIRRWTNGPTY
jgi:phosphoribosylglycinamide formyltransferase 1